MIGLYYFEDAVGRDRSTRMQAVSSFVYQALPRVLCALLAAEQCK
jgi:hypothetical protein